MKRNSHLTRREFTQNSALTAAGLAALGGLSFVPALEASSGIRILTELELTPRLAYAIDRLSKGLTEVGIAHQRPGVGVGEEEGRVIRIASAPQLLPEAARRAEGFSIRSSSAAIEINGFDSAGILYACEELGEQVRKIKALPISLDLATAPKTSMRGIALALMTSGKYEFPITERQFPWFYDQMLWSQTLDFLFEQRLNFISLWNAHPFPYFIKMSKYPEVKVLSDAEFERNVQLMEWLSHEADKRNIWLMFQFYNIYVPRSFAIAHGIFQNGIDESASAYALSEPTPLVSDYTRYVIQEFVGRFPSIGLYVCLGEALNKDLRYWMDDVILAAVKASGRTPPVILRNWNLEADTGGHETDGLRILSNVKTRYDNLYTEMKHNDEMYAVPDPDPANAEWMKQSHKHIISVHLMGNLKPFRWAPLSFIQETARDQQRMGAQGVQVFPLWFWYWPYSADSTRLLQIDRDWLWYAAWGRYAWNADRPQDQEEQYWKEKIAEKFGVNSAADILAAYEASGRVMPSVPRMFWFDGWNHWFASNGLTLEQILSGKPIPYKNTPPMPSVEEYAVQAAIGKSSRSYALTPLILTIQMVSHGRKAMEFMRAAEPLLGRGKDEFSRLRTDIKATLLIAEFYHAKLEAAVHFVAYQMKGESHEKIQFLELMTESVDYYRQLVNSTDRAYAIANDIQNDIPFPFHPSALSRPLLPNSIPHLPHWRDFLPVFESELEVYKRILA